MKYFLRSNNTALFEGQTEQKQCVILYFCLFSVFVYELVHKLVYFGCFDNIKLNISHTTCQTETEKSQILI